jgi:hypothetical protein
VGASVANDATMRAFVASPNSTKANKAKTFFLAEMMCKQFIFCVNAATRLQIIRQA